MILPGNTGCIRFEKSAIDDAARMKPFILAVDLMLGRDSTARSYTNHNRKLKQEFKTLSVSSKPDSIFRNNPYRYWPYLFPEENSNLQFFAKTIIIKSFKEYLKIENPEKIRQGSR